MQLLTEEAHALESTVVQNTFNNAAQRAASSFETWRPVKSG